MTTWLYRRFDSPFCLSADVLNQLGLEGWELVALTLRNDQHVCAYFKRPVYSSQNCGASSPIAFDESRARLMTQPDGDVRLSIDYGLRGSSPMRDQLLLRTSLSVLSREDVRIASLSDAQVSTEFATLNANRDLLSIYPQSATSHVPVP